MSTIDSPELNKIEEIVRDNVLTVLPEDWADQDDLDEGDVLAARSILAQEYVEHANIEGVLKILTLVVIYDLGYVLPSQAYGLVLSAYGSMVLASPSMHTPESLVGNTLAESRSLEDRVRIKAREAVRTNVGVIPLLCGFLVQLFAVVRFTPAEFIRYNILVGAISSWVGAIGLWIAADLYLKGPVYSAGKSIFWQ